MVGEMMVVVAEAAAVEMMVQRGKTEKKHF